MKVVAKEILRWVVTVASGGFGLWQVVKAGRGIMRWNGDWLDALVVLVFPLVAATPFLAVAYICLHRQYRKLFIVLGVVGCIAVFAELSALPEQLGMFQFMDRHIHENHDYAFLGLPLCFLVLFGPIYAAAWFYRLCHRLAYPNKPRTRTRATRWLIWLGLLCMIVPTMIGMLVTFSKIMQSPNEAVSLDSIRTTIGMSVVGTLLMFLGLVHQRPVTKSESGNRMVETSTSIP